MTVEEVRAVIAAKADLYDYLSEFASTPESKARMRYVAAAFRDLNETIDEQFNERIDDDE